MKKQTTILMAIAAFTMLSSAANATCVAEGEISRVSVNTGTAPSSFLVITSTPARPSYGYFTSDQKIIAAVVSAQASHMTVQVTGSAASCPAPASGIILGGTANTFTTAP